MKHSLNTLEVARAVARDSEFVQVDQEWVTIPGQPGILAAGDSIEAQVANPVQHPLGAPTVSGTSYTVDMALNAPTRVTRTVMDLSLQRFFADRVFANTGGVTGGAAVYDELIGFQLDPLAWVRLRSCPDARGAGRAGDRV
jgi:hypothetical protein